MKRLLAELAARLEELEAKGLRSALSDPRGVDFSSNDYLGLSRHPELRERLVAALADGPLSAPASRLLRGNTPAHVALEERLARWKGTEAALLFNTGYHANAGVPPALVGRGDAVFSDVLNHASIVDGCLLSRAEVVRYRHRDAGELEDLLRHARVERRFVDRYTAPARGLAPALTERGKERVHPADDSARKT
ncbi:MAG: aminotransferase class I/II-fold pyridoxal phosphate-dependent enzyme [Actinomycetota bacterium]